jgi:NADH-quinone oxidoreductase subunit G
VQSFTGVVRPLGDARPGWKVLRVLGDLLGADMSAFNSSEDVKAEALANSAVEKLGARVRNLSLPETISANLERVADVPIYNADSIVRRGNSLALTAYGKQPQVRVCQSTADRLGLAQGADVRVAQGGFTVTAKLRVDDTVAPDGVRIPLATATSAQLGDATAAISLEAA